MPRSRQRFGCVGPRLRLNGDLEFNNLPAIMNTKGRDGTTSPHVWKEGQEKGAGMAFEERRRQADSINEPEAELVREKETRGSSS